MNKEKRIWIALFLALALMVILSGCSGLPKIAKVNITIIPNPVPYSSENENWLFDVVLEESNGVGVTLTSVRFDAYDQAEQLYHTLFLYVEDIIYWFESNYLPAFSSLQCDFYYSIAPKYTVLTIEGVDDNNNPIEATVRIDYLPQ